MGVKLDFPNADYYDCRDGDELIHETPEEALEEYIDNWLTPGCDVVAAIRELAPITVASYRRDELEDGWIQRRAELLLEQAAEEFSEEFGNPDGDDDGLDKEAITESTAPMIAVLKQFFTHATVYNCTRIGETLLDTNAIEQLMREARPDWFEDAAKEVSL